MSELTDWTDEQLAVLEERIRQVYEEAAADLAKEQKEFVEHFAKMDKKYRAMVESGEWTEEQYKAWKTTWANRAETKKVLVQQAAQRAVDADKLAMEYVRDTMKDTIAAAHNYVGYEVEKLGINLMDTVNGVRYGIVNENTMKALLTEADDILPNVNAVVDLAWNRQQFANKLASGIAKGSSIDDISKDLANTFNMDYNSARRAARTGITAAENYGRMRGYVEMDAMGVHVKKQWLSTLDKRTRHEHQILDGQVREYDEPFEVLGDTIMYPGDPNASSYLTQNCRCTLISVDPLADEDAGTRVGKFSTEYEDYGGNITYPEWLAINGG